MSSVGSVCTFAPELRGICGAEHVIEDPAQLAIRQVHGVTPALAAEPASVDEVAAVLRFAHDRNLAVAPVGGRTQQQTGKPPHRVDLLLSTARLQDVEHYDPADLTIGVGAGVTIARLCETVANDGLLFAGDPAWPERTTVGGLLASGITGPLRHGYGGLRDYCIGVRFVTGDGRLGKGGGHVVKNVAGYDLMKLLIGSWGTLGVITGVSFKLFPAPRERKTFVAEFGTATEAIAFRDIVLRSPLSPICLELVSPEAGALLPVANKFAMWSVYVRAAGSEAVIARYRKELAAAVSRELEGAHEHEAWRALTDFPREVCGRRPQSLLLTLALPVKEVMPVLERLTTVCHVNGLRFAAIGRIGVGQLLINIWSDGRADLPVALAAIRNQVSSSGSVLVLHAPPPLDFNVETWQTPTHPGSMRAVKQALDPKDILNRGRFSL